MTTTYEFVVETLDFYTGCGDDPDVMDTWGFDTLAKATAFTTGFKDPWRIALRRDVGDEDEGLTDRAYAYPDADGRLPEYMTYGAGEEGPRVPVRFLKIILPLDNRAR